MFRLISNYFYNRKRKKSGTIEIEDPRPIAAENPYTFFLPSKEELDAITEGTTVKLIIRSVPPSRTFEAERMWVIVDKRDDDNFTGKLDNIPFDIPQLRLHDELHFQKHHIISVLWEDEETAKQFDDGNDKWFARCLVDDCIIYENAEIGFLYREVPETLENCDFPDTGWRIRAQQTGMTNEEIDNLSASFIAIGKILNQDESILELLEEPVGSFFKRNPDNNRFEPVQ